MSTYMGTASNRAWSLQHSTAYHATPVSRKRAYRGPLQPPSEATLAKRASEARMLARGACSTCHVLLPASGECC